MKRFFSGLFALAFFGAVFASPLFAQDGVQYEQLPAISALEARDIALAMTDGGTVTSLEIEETPGVPPVFNITIVNAGTIFDISISAETGGVLRMASFNAEVLPGVSAAPPATVVAQERPRRIMGIFRPNISRDQAVEIAYAHLASRNIQASFLTDSGIGLERGRWVWELEFRSNSRAGIYEVYVSTRNGEIIKVEFDSGW
ncbi:MAG: PepSY domain-containing protein [Spirochaetes bacterium]|nr:PepSY domain-containing protein [Spirochaetota bacterium]